MRTSAFLTWLGVSFLSAGAACAETLPIWWANSLAGPNVEALEEAFEQEWAAPITMRGPNRADVKVATCDSAADASSRHYAPLKTGDHEQVLKCVALGEVLFAAEAARSTFRTPTPQEIDGTLVPGGAPKPLGKEAVNLLPALFAPYQGCGFGVLALRASDQFWPLVRFAHVYGAGKGDDGREAETLAGTGPKRLTVEERDAGAALRFEQNGMAATVTLLALADFDADGTEDALFKKSAGGVSKLYMVSQFRNGAVMRVKNLGEVYRDLLNTCPDLMVDLARTSVEVAE